MVPLLIAGAVIGAAAGGISTYSRSQREQEQLRQQRAMARVAYGYEREYSQNTWNLQRSEALETLGIQKNRLAQAFNMDVAGFNLGLEGQAQQNQAAQVSLADSKGMALAQQGMSGVKGSDALQRRIEFSENQFERQLDIQDRGNSLAMQNMTTQYSNQFSDIGREIASWQPGGYRTQAKSLSDVYAEQMHGLQMQGYKQAISNAQAGPLDYLTGMLGGAFSGANFGASMNRLNEQRPGAR